MVLFVFGLTSSDDIKPKVKKMIPQLNYLSDEDLDLLGAIAGRLEKDRPPKNLTL
ncbi:MAG: hypothetical protein IJP61_01785 [Treponema sp.]|nr:hypothetical protein [Treponema sp.]